MAVTSRFRHASECALRYSGKYSSRSDTASHPLALPNRRQRSHRIEPKAPDPKFRPGIRSGSALAASLGAASAITPIGIEMLSSSRKKTRSLSAASRSQIRPCCRTQNQTGTRCPPNLHSRRWIGAVRADLPEYGSASASDGGAGRCGAQELGALWKPGSARATMKKRFHDVG